MGLRWITTQHIHLSGCSQLQAPEDWTYLCRGFSDPVGEDRKTLFLHLAAHRFIFVSPIDFHAQMKDVTGRPVTEIPLNPKSYNGALK